MRKLIKRAATLTLAVLLVISLGVTAFAADGIVSNPANVFAASPRANTDRVIFVIGLAGADGVATPQALEVTKMPELAPIIWAVDGIERAKFGGWFMDEACTKPVEIGASVKKEVFVYAKWDHIDGCPGNCDEDCPCFCHDRAGGGDMGGGATGDYDRFIIVKKTFNNLTRDLIPEDFKIQVKKPAAGTSPEKTVEVGIDPSKLTQGGTSTTFEYTWKVNVEPNDTYTITESGYDVPDYNCASNTLPNGLSITVDPSVAELTHVKDIPACTGGVANIGIQEEGKDWLLAIASNGNGTIIVSTRDLGLDVLKAVEAQYGNNNYKPPFYYKNIGDGAVHSIKGAASTFALQYDKDAGIVNVFNTAAWSNAQLFSYSIAGALEPIAKLDNTYTRKTTEVTIHKEVTGNMGDVNEEFDFEVSSSQPLEPWVNGEGVQYILSQDDTVASFTLKHGQHVTLQGVQPGSTLIVKELGAVGYKMKVDDEEITGGSYEYQVPLVIPSDGLSFTVENNQNVDIDTGVILDSLPYVLILALVAVGAVFFLRRRRDDD